MALDNIFSTSHALLDIVTSGYDAINDEKFAGLIMVDSRKAFDAVSYEILPRKLQNYGVRGVVGELITNYLLDRKQCEIVNGNKSNLCRFEIGVPQGSILGPLLYTMCVNDLPNSISCCATLATLMQMIPALFFMTMTYPIRTKNQFRINTIKNLV